MTETNRTEGCVHLVEDDAVLADGLALLLASRGLQTHHHDSAETFLAFIDDKPDWHRRPSCLLLDVRMRDISGRELFDRLRARYPDLPAPVIFLTGHADIASAVDAVKNGAFDFFEKPSNDNRLVDRVIEALDVSHERLAHAINVEELRSRFERLTARERAVMDLILAGKLNKVIADELGISVRTVEVHRANVFSKMGVRSAVELARLLESLPK